MKKTTKFFISAALLPALAALMPCTAGAQVDPGGRKPEPDSAPLVAGTSKASFWGGTIGDPFKAAAGMVGIGGVVPVTISNTPATPVYTVNAGSTDRLPYVLGTQFSFQSTQGPIYGSASLINNTSKLFVITSISSAGGMANTDVLANCNVNIVGTSATGGIPALATQFFQVPAVFSGVLQETTQAAHLVQYTGNAMTLLYLLPGQTTTVGCTRASAPGQTLGPGNLDLVIFNLTGHLEDVPLSAQ